MEPSRTENSDIFRPAGLSDLSSVSTFNLEPDKTSLIDNDSVVHVCIGDLRNALEGTVEAGLGKRPEKWAAETRVIAGGTVLFQDVDMLLPVHAGEWKTALLTTRSSGNTITCGCIFWHAETVGPDPSEAACLIREMEKAGESVLGGNSENKETLELGIRYIGRYAWGWYRGVPTGPEDWPAELKQISFACDLVDRNSEPSAYQLFSGPTCFFVRPETYLSKVLPEMARRVEVLKQPDCCKSENDNILISGGISLIAGGSGAVCVLPNQEYMFGRVFFDDESKKVARAFMYFTYNVPMESFGFVSVGGAPVCPLPPIECSSKLVDPFPKDSSGQQLQKYWSEWTPTLQQHFVLEAANKRREDILSILGNQNLLTGAVLAHVFPMVAMFSDGGDRIIKLLIDVAKISGTMKYLNEKDRERFAALQEYLVDKESTATFERSKPSSVYRLQQPGTVGLFYQNHRSLLRNLLEAGAAADHILCCRNDFLETPLMVAAAEGDMDSLELLLKFKADPYETVAPFNWPPLAYAAWNLQMKTLSRLLKITGDLCKKSDFIVDLQTVRNYLRADLKFSELGQGTLVDIALLGFASLVEEVSASSPIAVSEAENKFKTCVALLRRHGVEMSPGFKDIFVRALNCKGEKRQNVNRLLQRCLALLKRC